MDSITMAIPETEEGLIAARDFHTPPEGVEDWSFPLPSGTTWAAWHVWVEGKSTWVDGRLLPEPEAKGNGTLDIDVGCLGDLCCVDAAQGLAAVTLWSERSILLLSHMRAPALILPFSSLTTALIEEALTRADDAGIMENLALARTNCGV